MPSPQKEKGPPMNKTENKIVLMTIEERRVGYLKEYRELLDENMVLRRGTGAKANHKRALRKKWGFPIKGPIEDQKYE